MSAASFENRHGLGRLGEPLFDRCVKTFRDLIIGHIHHAKFGEDRLQLRWIDAPFFRLRIRGQPFQERPEVFVDRRRGHDQSDVQVGLPLICPSFGERNDARQLLPSAAEDGRAARTFLDRMVLRFITRKFAHPLRVDPAVNSPSMKLSMSRVFKQQ